MELLYIWIEDYKNIKNQGFNFSPLYDFEFTPTLDENGKVVSGTLADRKTEEERKELEKVYNGFFHKDITNITAIIGENGSGKTTIIRFLEWEVFVDTIGVLNKDEFSLIFIYKIQNNEIYVVLADKLIGKVKKNPNLKIALVKDTVESRAFLKQFLDSTSCSHYSFIVDFVPYYENEMSLGADENFYDISNHAEVRKKLKRTFKEYTFPNHTEKPIGNLVSELNTINSQILWNIYHDDVRFQALFISHFHDKGVIPFRLPAFLKGNSYNLKIRIFDQNTKVNTEYKNYITKFKEWLAKFFNPINLESDFIRSFIAPSPDRKDLKNHFIFNFIVEVLLDSLTEEKFLESPKTYIDPINDQNDADNFKRRLEFIFAKAYQFMPVASNNKTNVQNIISFINYLINLEDKHYYSESGFVFSSIEHSNLIQECMELYEDTFLNNLLFDWVLNDGSGLSTGEQAFFTLFSRFFKINRLPKLKNNIAIFIDEGEIGLHPQWQKQYLKNLIEVLPQIFPDKKIQLILTSHSPFLVSDLPKENVIFLEKGKSVPRTEQTFGQNIHTLFADSFFMDKNGGLMGEFAKSKIQTLIDYLDKKESEIKDDQTAQKLLDLIGELILKRQLQKKLFEKPIKNSEKAERIAILKQLLAQEENDTH